MAEALVVGALVSGSISLVLNRLISPEFVNSVVSKKLDWKLVERLKTALLAAKALAADAEQKQFGNEYVREWLDSLRDALYTADDLLDRALIKAEIRKKVLIPLPYFLSCSNRKMVTKIEEVVERIEYLEKRKDALRLRDIPTGSSSWRPPSTSLERGTMYGRDGDQQALIKMLKDNKDHNLSVISIVGMGGVGKTTLAKCLYNNKDLMNDFDPKAWICVSENFNVTEITKSIIKEINSGVCSLDSLDLLQQDLKERLSKGTKKFFIVLDDVWSIDGDIWKDFIIPFQHGPKSTTILLTTRMKNLDPIVQNHNSYLLEGLSESYCWSIFADNASFPESNGSSELQEIGKEIVKKCAGLPLAAETLGRLCSKHDVEKWKSILESDTWEFPMIDSKIIPALLISYNELPAHLKRCFVYCSLYPKSYQFDKNELILLWMAEDLLRPPRRRETLEDVGRECFDDLASRLFFKPREKYFVMHDLMHDLATFLAREFYCRLSKELCEKEEMWIRTRHCSFNHPISKKGYSSDKIKYLRTFLYFNDGHSFSRKEGTRLTGGILSENKYLRVLSSHALSTFPGSIVKLIHLRYLNLSGSDFKVLPKSLCNLGNLQTLKLQRCSSLTMLPSSLGELIHLHYLDLSISAIKTLPESLCKLSYLQTLKLGECSKLTMLPNDMCNLVDLRHLDIWGTPIKEMPKGMSKLEKLHILSNFVVGKHEDNGIQELGGLSNLHGLFVIQKLENVVDVNHARKANMKAKEHIDNLLLEWSSGDDMVPESDSQTERDILSCLQPYHGLKVLGIKEYKGTIFPDWVGHSSYQNMTSVSLLDCKNCCMLPSLGQLPCLKSLNIEGFDKLKSVGMEFYKNEGDQHSSPIALFPSLESLEFDNMQCWEEWHLPDSQGFPKLEYLHIRDCPVLKENMLNHVLMRIISSSSDVLKMLKLEIQEGHEAWGKEMRLDEDSLSITGCESVLEYAIVISHLTSLQEIHISECSSAVSLHGNCLPKSLQKLTIWKCSKLEFPEQQQQKYDNLAELQIVDSCDSLTSLSLDAFPVLKNLEIRECSNLESVSMSERPYTALQRLTISFCNKLVSFTGERLDAPNLTHFDVSFCFNLGALPSHMNILLASLQSLDIRGCPNISRLSEGSLPPNLKQLSVGKRWRDLLWKTK
ncbi:hypothetical protein PIB30_029069 [Stylosanthes scabra]|uniref:Disease resistance RPP13-like protein 1 n=1 Tax=Stylosanthes scabra TaxID=79078 RepID=A0ABU6SBY7_9FABA|nr:hypothetical protein [Stylosanthes scabra]